MTELAKIQIAAQGASKLVKDVTVAKCRSVLMVQGSARIGFFRAGIKKKIIDRLRPMMSIDITIVVVVH